MFNLSISNQDVHPDVFKCDNHLPLFAQNKQISHLFVEIAVEYYEYRSRGDETDKSKVREDWRMKGNSKMMTGCINWPWWMLQ